MSRYDHPAYGTFRVVCDDNIVVTDTIPAATEAVDFARELAQDTDAHANCQHHKVERQEWVTITTVHSLERRTYTCDACGRDCPIEQIATVRSSWHDECNACPACRGVD